MTKLRSLVAGPPVEDLRYSLGFLTGTRAERIPGHFRRIEFPRLLAVHPNTQVAVARCGSQPLAILGEAVHPDLPDLDLQAIADHLAGNDSSRQAEIDKLVGRFAVIRGSGSDWRIQTDAIGMRTVCFFVSDDGVVAGSHASLVAEAGPGAGTKKIQPFHKGYPGISTAYASVLRLPPNCELSLTDGTLTRFFPQSRVPKISIDRCWDFAFERAAATITALARTRRLVMSLTAGLDSRTTLAACPRDIWPHITFFTYNGCPKDQLDVNVAEALAKALGLRHVIVDYSVRYRPDEAVAAAIRCNTFTSHKRKLACAYHSQLGEHVYLHLRSNLLELSRSKLYYNAGRGRGLRDPRTAESMGEMYRIVGGLTPEASAHVVPAFAQYIAASNYKSTIRKVSPWDLYFVEHRMGAWHSGILLESDVSFDTVIAFNSREVVRHFMGVPQKVRYSSTHLRERLNAVLPEVRDIPINPEQYPVRVA